MLWVRSSHCRGPQAVGHPRVGRVGGCRGVPRRVPRGARRRPRVVGRAHTPGLHRCAKTIENISRIRMVVARASGTLMASSLKQNTFWTLKLRPGAWYARLWWAVLVCHLGTPSGAPKANIANTVAGIRGGGGTTQRLSIQKRRTETLQRGGQGPVRKPCHAPASREEAARNPQ